MFSCVRPPVRLVVSIDVEEEGLFAQDYHCQHTPVRNVAHLTRLIPLLRETGIAPTLFCAHAVFTHAESCRTIEHLRDTYGAEVGAHLHHWNTPPVRDTHKYTTVLHGSAAVSTALVPLDSMREKLHTLFAAGEAFQGAPLRSFRMGRWDMRREHWPLLAEMGVTADASVRPLHCGCVARGNAPVPPDHFMAPREPYTVRVHDRTIFELPLTTTPLLPVVPRMAEWAGARTLWGKWLRSSVQKWGALTLLPVYQPLWLLQLCTLAHIRGGGSTLSLTWHSSEMMPQGAPHMQTEADVDAFMYKMQKYMVWLQKTCAVEPLTLHQLTIKYSSKQSIYSPIIHNKCLSDWMYE